MSAISDICQEMDHAAKNDIAQHPGWWINQATNLHILFAPIYKKYFVLMKEVATEKAEYLRNPDMTSAKAKAIVEAMPEYWEAQELKSQKKYIDDLIMLAKKMASMTESEYKGY